MKTIYKSFIREINTLGWEAEFLTDHVEFFYQGYRFRVVLEDEEDDLLRISANILSTDKSVREWIAILFECEGTWESPTYVYDVREEGDTFHIDVAISALFLFSQDIHNTALYFQDYVMREIMTKIEMIYECFRENYDKNFNVQLAEKGDRIDLLQKDFIPTYYKEVLTINEELNTASQQPKGTNKCPASSCGRLNPFIAFVCIVLLALALILINYYYSNN